MSLAPWPPRVLSSGIFRNLLICYVYDINLTNSLKGVKRSQTYNIDMFMQQQRLYILDRRVERAASISPLRINREHEREVFGLVGLHRRDQCIQKFALGAAQIRVQFH